MGGWWPQGLGPNFQLVLVAKNEGSKHVGRITVILDTNDALYSLERRQFVIPSLVPSLGYTFTIDVRCLQPDCPPGSIRVIFSQGSSCAPLLSALVKMPLSEPEEM